MSAPAPGSARPRDPYTVVGGGAIGGTLAFHLARAGHPVEIVDADAAHVAAIRERGLTLTGPDGERTVRVDATTPDEAEGAPRRVLLCVKAGATEAAASWLAGRLAPDGYVVSLQNGLNESLIAELAGADRTVGAFVNLFADVVAPGAVRDGGGGALVVGELDGRPSERVRRLVADLQAWGPARETGNVHGYLWAKLAFGAMLTATALVDAPMAGLIDGHRPLMHALAAEVEGVATAAGLVLEPFDAFTPAAYLPGADPAERERATDRLVGWLGGQSKDRSGIWRDIAVRHRPVEVHHHYRPVLRRATELGVPAPLLPELLGMLAEVESGARPMDPRNLTDLAHLTDLNAPIPREGFR
ncbi:ketopantoate reductase family protein [Streptomyces sp. TS71-3]|uniref:ketopantoate reductase family protein n=1 Tax=Streptomyces sp. TS71-3 TaxID=2733862 RepID=UPI001B1C8BE8|nr:2-dehydropantoate 2-reductase [Streptomyces sp. TS71-3]GHJ36820.1 2-dehydropantoate 2-reductase [Streptomyces sp. TS71-3]